MSIGRKHYDESSLLDAERERLKTELSTLRTEIRRITSEKSELEHKIAASRVELCLLKAEIGSRSLFSKLKYTMTFIFIPFGIVAWSIHIALSAYDDVSPWKILMGLLVYYVFLAAPHAIEGLKNKHKQGLKKNQ